MGGAGHAGTITNGTHEVKPRFLLNAHRCTKIIDADPNDAMNWVVLAQLSAAPRQGESVAPIQRAAELSADLPIVQYELGNFYLSRPESYSEAMQAFERTLRMSPRHFQSMIISIDD